MKQWQVHVHLQSPAARRGSSGTWAALAGVIAAAAGCSVISPSPSPAAVAAAAAETSRAAAQPETEAGVRAAATQFYAFYAAALWPQAWALLTPASQQAAPESVYVALHQGCPSASAGFSRVIQSVVMAGSTAVVTESGSGAAAALGSVTDAWSYAGGRWGIALDRSAMAVYSHGSATADLAAAKAAGDCAGAHSLPTLATVAPATMPPPPTPATLAPLPTVAAS